jgi:site-specific DNA recombinase
MAKKGAIVKVGVYLRKSRAEDGTQDLKKHKDYLIEVCDRNNWLYELYEEIDSSQDLDRAELQRLRNDIGLGKIDAVMVHAVDRLSRRSRHFLEIIEDYFIAQGMTTLFVKDTENNLLDPTTITMLQLQATLSQAEYSFIISRLREGRKASAKEGIWSGKMVYGYTFDPC